MKHFILFALIAAAPSALGRPSPRPQDVVAPAAEFSVPNTLGATRGEYRDLAFGDLLFDTGPNPLEETALGEVRRWLYHAKSGRITIGNATYDATCIRARRINTLTPSQEFHYEMSISAQEGSCSAMAEDRSIEISFTMDDFVIKKYRTGQLRFFGQTTNLLLYATPLRLPDRIKAVATDGGYLLSGKLRETPFVANLQMEFILREKGQMSCRTTASLCPASGVCETGNKCDAAKAEVCSTKPFNTATDPYVSLFQPIDSTGRYGLIVPKTGGAICMRLSGGGWLSPMSPVTMP